MLLKLISNRFPECHYLKKGEGFPIILIHGFGENLNIWKYQADFLSPYYTLIIPDLPGTGSSLLTKEKMSMELLADFILEVMEQEKISHTILLGHSMGGYAALAFAEKYPQKLRAFGLIHSSAFPDNEEKIENRKKAIRLIENEGKEAFLNAMIPYLYSEHHVDALRDEIDAHLTMALGISSASLVAYYRAMMERPGRTAVLQYTDLPVLYVIGKNDKAIPETDMINQSTMSAISVVEYFSKSAHTGMYEEKELMNQAILNFCKYVLQAKIV